MIRSLRWHLTCRVSHLLLGRFRCRGAWSNQWRTGHFQLIGFKIVLMCGSRPCISLRSSCGFGCLIGADDRVDHIADTLLFQNALHTFDRVSLIIKQMANTFEQINIIGTIVATTAAPLHRLDLGEAGFPKAQHMLRQVEILRNFADRPKCIWAFAQDSHLARVTDYRRR